MSNRDGKGAKKRKSKTKYILGKLCPKCKKNKLEKCDQGNKEGHKSHVYCPTCHVTNF